ncbi:MAG: DUF1285 domain-containing protein [Bacillota bacterium]
MYAQELKIAQDGKWYWEGNQLTRMDIVQLFAEHLQQVGDGYAVCYKGQSYPVIIEDVPFVVTSFNEAGERLGAMLADGREVDFKPGVISLVNGTPYFSLFWPNDTKLSREAFWQLHRYLQEIDGVYRLRYNDQCWIFKQI